MISTTTATADILYRNNATGDTWLETTTFDGAHGGWQQIGGSDTHYSVVGIGDFSATECRTCC